MSSYNDVMTKVEELVQLIKMDASQLPDAMPTDGARQEIKNLMFTLIDIRHMAKLAADGVFSVDFYCNACDDPECIGDCEEAYMDHHCSCCGREMLANEDEYQAAEGRLATLAQIEVKSPDEYQEMTDLKELMDEYLERIKGKEVGN